jgi:hypothetical protein
MRCESPRLHMDEALRAPAWPKPIYCAPLASMSPFRTDREVYSFAFHSYAHGSRRPGSRLLHMCPILLSSHALPCHAVIGKGELERIMLVLCNKPCRTLTDVYVSTYKVKSAGPGFPACCRVEGQGCM